MFTQSRFRARPWRPAPARASLALLAILAVAPAPGFASPDAPTQAEQLARIKAIKRAQVEMNLDTSTRKLAAGKAYEKALKRAQRKGLPLPKKANRARRVNPDDDPSQFIPAPREAKPLSAEAALVIPTNVRANNPTGDDPSAGQAESAIAAWGPYALVAWNDGQGFVSGPDIQGYGYSTDGGATFTDGGAPPKPVGAAWTSDPSVTVNDATGDFYYCGLINPNGSTNGIGVARLTFPGGVLTWDTPHIAISRSNSTNFIDKEWLVADAVTGNLYLTYTNFFVGGDQIEFTRSTDQGATWSVPSVISSPAATGYVQGSRPVVGPDGELYVVWKEIGTGAQDYMKIRKSTNLGVTFGSEAVAASLYDNFGTGAPGFNRERGVTFPSIAVDRTTGAQRGRVYVSWHETVNWYDDLLGGAGSKSEVESNGSFGTATPFVPGQQLRGTLTTSDFDYWSFSASQGTTYIFWCDSIPRPLYTMRVYCSDQYTRLAYAGDLNSPAGGNSFIVWTAPSTATYYLRMSYVSGALTGGYHIYTGTNGGGPEPGRDTRDVFVTHSDNGTAWSAPSRVNDDQPYLDDWLPEVIVGADGCPYVTWFDWRDTPTSCGGGSNIYLSRSDDGGTTWLASQRVSDVTSNWTDGFTNIAPNQGDYSHMHGAADRVRWTWADNRSLNADTYVAGLDPRFALTTCPADTVITAGDSRDVLYAIANLNLLFGNTYSYSFTDQRGWLLPASGPIDVGANQSAPLTAILQVPDSAASGANRVCVRVVNAKGALVDSCCFTFQVIATTGVGDGPLAFGLRRAFPNPAAGDSRIDFTLPRSGPVRLRVYGLRGELIRTLVDGERGAGLNSVVWDGRDARGRRVAAGAYFVQLQGFGLQAVQRLTRIP